VSRPFIRSDARNRKWPPISLPVIDLTASGTGATDESTSAAESCKTNKVPQEKAIPNHLMGNT
jgi:hypothetical protein